MKHDRTVGILNPADTTGRIWHFSAALRISLIVHLCSAVFAAVYTDLWRWALGMVAFNHAVLTAAVLWPRGRLLGPNMTRLPVRAIRRNEISLTFDDGPDPGITPQILDLLDQYDAKGSFFCIAGKVSEFPELAREIVRRGHSIENHSNSHPYNFALLGWRGLYREISAAQETIRITTGASPEFFRAPMGFRSPFLAPVIEYAGLKYVTWTRRGYDVFEQNSERVLDRLLCGLAAGDILLMHDGRSHQSGGSATVVLETLPRLLDHMSTLGLRSVSLPAALKHADTI